VSRFRDGRVVTYGEQEGRPAAFVVTESSTGTLAAGEKRDFPDSPARIGTT